MENRPNLEKLKEILELSPEHLGDEQKLLEVVNYAIGLEKRASVVEKERELLLKWITDRECPFNHEYRGCCQRHECAVCIGNNIRQKALAELGLKEKI